MVADEASLLEAVGPLAPDVVVVDLSLPASEGGTIVCRLKRVAPDLRIIVLSVHDEAVAVEAALSAGAAGFVLKRTAHPDLAEAVRSVLGGDVYVSPACSLPGAAARSFTSGSPHRWARNL